MHVSVDNFIPGDLHSVHLGNASRTTTQYAVGTADAEMTTPMMQRTESSEVVRIQPFIFAQCQEF